MKKIEPTIIKETLYILVCVVILSAIMESVFLIIHRWDYTVLLGNLLTGFAVTLNFFLMGLGVQKSLEKDEKEAKKVIVFLVIGVVFSCFNNWAVFIPVVFPRIAVAIRPLIDKMSKKKETTTQEVVSQEVAEVVEVVEEPKEETEE